MNFETLFLLSLSLGSETNNYYGIIEEYEK